MGVQLGEAFVEHANQSKVTHEPGRAVPRSSGSDLPLHAYRGARRHAGGAVLVDIRDRFSREHDGVIPGAYHVPRTVLEWRVASDEYRNPALEDRRLILVCDHGFSTVFAASMLMVLGRDVGDVIGGFEAWKADGLETGVAGRTTASRATARPTSSGVAPPRLGELEVRTGVGHAAESCDASERRKAQRRAPQ